MRANLIFSMLVYVAWAAGLPGQRQISPGSPELPPSPVQSLPSLESSRSTKVETVERAGRDLRDPKEEIRLGAAKLLGKYKTPQSLTFLAGSLDDTSIRVRRAAIISFSEFLMDGVFVGNRSFMEKFLSKIGDPDVEVRRQVSQMLPRLSYGLFRSSFQVVEIGGRKVYRSAPYVLPSALATVAQRAFLDEDPIVRQNMLRYYYALRIPLPPLTLERLLGDEDRSVRMAALDRVSTLAPHDSVFRKLRELADHDDVGVRQKVASIARSTSHSSSRVILRSMRDDEDPYVMSMAVTSLARLGERQPDVMVAKVRDFLMGTTSASNQVISIVYAISAFGSSQARKTFRALTEHDSPKVRRVAWQRFLNYDNGWTNPDLWLPALEDRDKGTRKTITSVVTSRAGSFTPKVMTALVDSPYADVRRFAANCLALAPPAVSEEFRFDLLIDEKVEVRVAALRAVGTRRPTNWAAIMERSLLDEEFPIQRVALESLINDPARGIPVLVKFVQQHGGKPISAAIRAELANRNVVVP